jgi:serine/threonine-protein kinase HipA
MQNKCLYCYETLIEREIDFHQNCSKKFFGSKTPPFLELDKNRVEELAIESLKRKITVPGVQPKLSLDLLKNSEGQYRLTIIGLLGKFILKPPFDAYPEMPELEDLTMHMAELLKIKTAEHTLIKLRSGELSYLSKRFDRTKKDKLHVEDMAQLTETLAENKYRGSMEKIGKIILKFSAYPGIDIIRFFELTLFSFITGNSDMHLKNFSLIRNEEDEIVISPAYDLLATKLLLPNDEEDLALTLNGKKSNFSKKDFDEFSENLGINKSALKKIYEKFEQSFEDFYELINKSFLSDDMKEKYIDLLKERKKIIW